uniref:Chitin-binding type-2 domain-containing protein n=1 Tax=Stomoxys calcitrans TaxID=35570 RepID=A0A1I8Q152_STOCA
MNKKSLLITFVALSLCCAFAAADDECDMESDGEPKCLMVNVGQPFRNFWDPTAYWLCTAANRKAELRHCPYTTLYDAATISCIPASKWKWTPPCSE